MLHFLRITLVTCTLIITTTICATNTSNEKINSEVFDVKDIQVSTQLYLQSCDGNPQNYYKYPKSRDKAIQEVPSKVVKIAKTEFGRPFRTIAEAKLISGNTELNAKMTNFRDLEITDNLGKVLYSRRISGAASLYEIFYKGQVVALGIGWNKYCGVYDIDFTTFRVIAPSKDGVNATIYGAFDFKDYLKLNQDSKLPILYTLEATGSGVNAFYYYIPAFYVLDPKVGTRKLNTYEELEKVGGDIKYLSPFLQFRYLISVGEYDRALEFLNRNGLELAKDMAKEKPGEYSKQSYVELWEACKDRDICTATDSAKSCLMQKIKQCFVNPINMEPNYLASNLYGLPFWQKQE